MTVNESCLIETSKQYKLPVTTNSMKVFPNTVQTKHHLLNSDSGTGNRDMEIFPTETEEKSNDVNCNSINANTNGFAEDFSIKNTCMHSSQESSSVSSTKELQAVLGDGSIRGIYFDITSR